MSDEEHRPKAWDLEQYHVSAKTQAPPEAAGDGPGARPPRRDEFLIERDSGMAWRGTYEPDGRLFLLALRGALLSVLTLGIYRFWMITALRRYYCNAMRMNGDPLEYSGRGLEKLLGFLIAMVILAVYLAIVNVALTFVGLSYFDGNPLAVNISIVAAVPLYFWAAYRARRYIMARLRWRGIRFGQEPGAFRYMWLSLWLSILTVLSAGLALPYQHFRQSKFMTDRSFFGDLRFHQGGSWWGLFALWIRLYLVGGLLGLFGWALVVEYELEGVGVEALTGVLGLVGGIALIVLFIAYQVGSFRYLWSTRSLAEADFLNKVSTKATVWTYFKGNIAVSFLSGIVIAAVMIVLAGAEALLPQIDYEALMVPAETGEDVSTTDVLMAALPLVLIAATGYLVVIAFWFALNQVFLTQPLLDLKVQTMFVQNPAVISAASQRGHDQATEAGGFADALGVDLGAGF